MNATKSFAARRLMFFVLMFTLYNIRPLIMTLKLKLFKLTMQKSIKNLTDVMGQIWNQNTIYDDIHAWTEWRS